MTIPSHAKIFNQPIIAPNYYIKGELWGDYLLPGTAIAKGSNAPDLETFIGNIQMNAFAGTGPNTEQGYFTTHILHDIKPDTTISFHVHWAHNISSGSYTSGTNSVKWQIECTFAKGYGVQAFFTPTTTSSTQVALGQYCHHITDDDDMPLLLPSDDYTIEPDTVVLTRIFRDPTEDDFEHDAFLIQADIHYQVGQMGTKERNRPYMRF